MTSKKIDQLLLALGMLLISISSYQLFLWRSEQSHEGLTLGTLVNSQSVVKLKAINALDWKDAFSGAEVGDQQLIFTDSKSSVEIKFLKGADVLVSENSLIRIASIGTTTGLKIDKGFIRAKIKNNEPLIINVNGSELTMSAQNADVQINIQGEAGEIGVISGEVSVQKGTQSEKITPAEVLKVTTGPLEVKPITLRRLEPFIDQVLYTLEDTHRATFKWEPEIQGEVLVANNPMLKKARVFRGTGLVTADLLPGVYYWKVEDAQGSSLIGSFKVVRELTPTILRPTNGEKIILPRENAEPGEIFLQWKSEPGVSYLVEWSDEETHQKLVTTSGLVIPMKKSGVLNWRTKIESQERPLAQWSDWQNVEVTIVDLPTVPEQLAPHELELQSYSKEAQDIELSWTSSTPVELEVLSPKNERILKTVESSPYLHKVKDPGQYRWRVRGKDRFKRLGQWSEWKSFTLEDLSSEVNSEGFQRIQLKKPDQSVTFNWKAASGTNTVFELSARKDFAEVIIKKEVTGEEVNVVMPQVGDYYWRSRQFLPDGTINVSEPRKVIIEAAPAPSKPEKLPDLEVPLNFEETSYQPNSHWWNFLISEAHAENIQGVATIQLPLNEDAQKFVIKIYSDPTGSNLVFEQTLDSKTLKWKAAKAGQYYWQYALIDFWGRQSPFSDLSTLTVTGVEPTQPAAPKLVTPVEAAELDSKTVSFKWAALKQNKSHRLEVSSTADFQNILYAKATDKNKDSIDLDPGTYFWRVSASNELKKEVTTRTGSFKILPPIEKITVVDQLAPWQKVFPPRLSLAWAPSQDSFSFKDEGKTGSISGSALNSLEARGLYFTEKSFLSADLLRQSGKVFKSENYLFQRFLLHATWKQKIGNHFWGPGLSLGHVSGFSYEIQSGVAKARSVSGLLYGPHLQGFYSVNPLWELQGKLVYLLGAVPHLEATTEINRKIKTYYFLLGAGFSNRQYSKPDGSQSSLRLTVGLGKEF